MIRRLDNMNFYGDVDSLIMPILRSIQKEEDAFRRMSKEEQQAVLKEEAEWKLLREIEEEERRVINCIAIGVCPTCKFKLTRGKKDKNNDYKRECKCLKCNEVYYRW